MEFDRDLRARQEVRLLAQQAQQAFEGLQKLDQSGLDRITEALSRAGALHAAELAREACAETGFGNERDKTEKNRFAAVRVFGAIRAFAPSASCGGTTSGACGTSACLSASLRASCPRPIRPPPSSIKR